jgi:hypothetical protein
MCDHFGLIGPFFILFPRPALHFCEFLLFSSELLFFFCRMLCLISPFLHLQNTERLQMLQKRVKRYDSALQGTYNVRYRARTLPSINATS